MSTSNDEFKLSSHQEKRVQLGSDVTLPCHLHPDTCAVDMEIRWFKGTDCVCLYKNRQVKEGRGYNGRVSLSDQELERGNVSLQLRESRESDIGHYLCYVTDGDRKDELTVRVWWHPLQSLNRIFQCGSVPYVNVQQWGRKWSEEEKMKMVESALLTEYNTDVKSLMKELVKKDTVLEKTKQDLKTTKLELLDKTTKLELLDKTTKQEKATTDLQEAKSLNVELPVPLTELRLVLLGRSGSGKTAARNTILDGDVMSQAGTSTPTQQSESTQGEVAGRKVTVVDTTDWFGPELSLEEVRQDVGHCVRLSAPGPHAFLLVLPAKQSPEEERAILERMEEIFGEGCWRNTMIIYTVEVNEAQVDSSEEFIQTCEDQNLAGKCENRFHYLNIKQKGEGGQVSELLEKIERMVKGNRGRFYSSQIYLKTEAELETIILEAREKKDRELKKQLDKEVQNSLRKTEGMIQEHEEESRQINQQIADLEKRVNAENDEEKKRDLERNLEREMQKRSKMENLIIILKEKITWERSEMEEKHKQGLEETARAETGRDLMKIVPALQKNILTSKLRMHDDFSLQIEEKIRELESLKQRLSKLEEELQKTREESKIPSQVKVRKRGGSI